VKDLGDSAKYWNYDPQAAKQLLTAAGIDKPIDSQMSHYDASIIGPQFPNTATVIEAGWKQLNIANVADNNLPAVQARNVTLGQYDGMGLSIQTGAAGLQKGNQLRSFLYWGPDGTHAPQNASFINDTQLSALALKQFGQLNAEDRHQTFLQMEPIMALQQYVIVLSSTSQSWFWDPSLVNTSMSQEQTSRRYAMKWWFA